MAKVTILVQLKTGKSVDVETGTDISASAFIRALYQAMRLSNDCPDFIRCENPVAILHGDMPLSFFGLRDGSILHM